MRPSRGPAGTRRPRRACLGSPGAGCTPRSRVFPRERERPIRLENEAGAPAPPPAPAPAPLLRAYLPRPGVPGGRPLLVAAARARPAAAWLSALALFAALAAAPRAERFALSLPA